MGLTSYPNYVSSVPAKIAECVTTEKLPTPHTFAYQQLNSRLPKAVFFDESARNLDSTYHLPTIAAAPPAALENLAEVAGLNLVNLAADVAAGDTAARKTQEEQANRTLAERFGPAWNQSGVRVYLTVSGENLEILVVNERQEFTNLAERSDGLRQFVALQSFAMCNWSNDTILLIDEAEQRLHYNAQADLVQMLARQNVVSKVIYTTHSAGCLPEDLGSGVRIAVPTGPSNVSSKVENKFWAANEPGFSALLFGMGASTMAFFPTRKAVVAEGAADMLLLPTMLRETLNEETLGFQVVPGLSSASKPTMPIVARHGTDVAYLVDGDQGGRDRQKFLEKKGNVEVTSIFSLKIADELETELEDFVDIDVYTNAVNAALANIYPDANILRSDELDKHPRVDCLEKMLDARGLKMPSKISVAYEILNFRQESPSVKLVDSRHAEIFEAIAKSIVAHFVKQATKDH